MVRLYAKGAQENQRGRDSRGEEIGTVESCQKKQD